MPCSAPVSVIPSGVVWTLELWLFASMAFTDTTSKLGRAAATHGSGHAGCAGAAAGCCAIAMGTAIHTKTAHKLPRINSPGHTQISACLFNGRELALVNKLLAEILPRTSNKLILRRLVQMV